MTAEVGGWRDRLAEVVDRLGGPLRTEDGGRIVCRCPGCDGDLSVRRLRHRIALVCTRPGRDSCTLNAICQAGGFDKGLLDLTALLPASPPTANGHAPAAALRLNTISAPDLMAREFPAPNPPVPGVIFEGVTLFAGREKTGKSLLMLNIARAKALGGRVFGAIAVPQGDVLYVDMENGLRRVQGRLREQLVGDEAPPGLRFVEGTAPRIGAGFLETLAEYLADYPRTTLIVIDTLIRLKPRPKPGQHRIYDEDYDSVSGLTDFAQRHPGLGIVLLHHCNKLGDPVDVLDSVSGSTGLNGGVDGIAIWRRERGKDAGDLFLTHRDMLNDAHSVLRWDPAIHGYVTDDTADPDEYRLSDQRKAVLRVLRGQADPMGPQEIATATGLDYGAVRVLLSQMAKAGQVQTPAYGKYTASLTLGHTPNTAHTAEFRAGNGPDDELDAHSHPSHPSQSAVRDGSGTAPEHGEEPDEERF